MEEKKAMWNEVLLAQSNESIPLEGNWYFPPQSVKQELLNKSDTPYTCPWKGECTYYNISAGGKELPDGAWSYQEPSEAAQNIKGYIAFAPQVSVT